jgi:hypothetical protein
MEAGKLENMGNKRVRDLGNSVYKEEWCTEGFTETFSKVDTCGVAPGPEELRWWGIKRGGMRGELELSSSMVRIDGFKAIGLVCV